MSSKTRALLWEELRTGGAIAAAVGAIGVVWLTWLRYGTLVFEDLIYPWHMIKEEAMAMAIGPALVTALLLTLHVSNSGDMMGGGFSRRILRLPVDTWNAVLVALAARLVEVLAVATVTVALCWALYQHGPGARTILVIGSIYLFIQVLSWMRAVAPTLVAVVLVAVLGMLFAFLGRWSAWGEALTGSGSLTPSLVLGFAVSVVLAYGLSVVLVKQARCGQRLAVLRAPLIDVGERTFAAARRKPFASPMAAQIWFEVRRTRFFLPLMTLLFWALGIGLMFLINYSDVRENPSHWFRKVKVVVGTHNLIQVPWYKDMLDPLWIFEIIPLAALLLAAVAWSLLNFRKGKPRAGRPATFEMRQPITKAMQAQAYLAAAGINLGLTLAVIAAVSTLSFLWADGGLAAGLIGQGLAHGETSAREVAAMLIGLPLMVGFLAWLFMGPGGLANGGLIALLGVLGMASAIVGHSSNPLDNGVRWVENIGLGALSFAVLFTILQLGAGLTAVWWQGLISKRSLIVCVLLWAAITVVFYPFSLTAPEGTAPVLLAVSLALSALVIMPYLSWMQVLSNRGWRGSASRENSAQHCRAGARRSQGRGRALGVGAVILVFAALAWVRWPVEAAWKTSLRAQGLPTNLDELNAWYAPVEKDKNLAERYLEAAAKNKQLESHWWETIEASGEKTPDDKQLSAYVLDNILVNGDANVKRAQPIPAEVWRWTQRYYEGVARDVCMDLHAAAQSGLTASRYPVELRQGYNVLLPCLAGLRTLARMLAIEAQVAAVERRPDAASNAILDIFPIEKSLKDEPLLISQLVRIAIDGIACGNLEDVMNRVTFSDAELKRIEDRLGCVLPPAEQERFMDRGMAGEEAMVLDASSNLGQTLSSGDLFGVRNSLLVSFASSAVTPLIDLLGIESFERLLTVRGFAMMRESARAAAQKNCVPREDPLDKLWTSNLRARAMVTFILMPALSRAYEAEWRLRTQLDLARTAVAVERFRLANGRLPDRLDELVPAFLDRVPKDMWNDGKPLSYRVKNNGGFVVYSFGYDRQDDLGDEKAGEKNYRDGDITFTVAPQTVRDQPQVASEPAPNAPGPAPTGA